MTFFDSLLIRITLAVIGGVFYALLTYWIVLFLRLPYEFSILASAFVYLSYLGSRLLLLFSGIDSPYYSKGRGMPPKPSIKEIHFYETAQWVGKFYHWHDLVLFVFLGILSIVFLISLVVDGLVGSPFGDTIRNLGDIILPLR